MYLAEHILLLKRNDAAAIGGRSRRHANKCRPVGDRHASDRGTHRTAAEAACKNERKTGEEVSLYQRKDKDGNLISPYWYCEFNDGGKEVRKSTEVKIRNRTEKAFEKSQSAARQAEALIKQQYFKEKEEAAEHAGVKADITFQEFSEKFIDWVQVKHKKKPKTVRYYKERVAALLRFEKLKFALLSKIDDELIAEFVQWRSKTTVMIAVRGKNKKVST